MAINILQKQLVQYPLVLGLDTKTDDKQSHNLLDLQNGQFTHPGQVNKRFGNISFTKNVLGAPPIDNAANVISYNDQLILFDGTELYTYIESNNLWNQQGIAFCVESENDDVIRTETAEQLNPDIGYLNGIELTAWEDTRGGVWYSVRDTETGAWILNDQPIGAGSQPKIVAFQNLLYLFIFLPGSDILYYITFNPFNSGIPTLPVSFISDGYSSFAYDVCINNNLLCVAYYSSSDVLSIRVVTQNNIGIQTSIIVENVANKVLNIGANPTINIVSDSNSNLWTTWCDGNNVRTACLSSSLNTICADTIINNNTANYITVIENPSVYATTGMMIITSDVYSAIPEQTSVWSQQVQVQSGILKFDEYYYIQKGIGLASKAFSYNKNVFVNLTYQSITRLQDTYFISYIYNDNFSFTFSSFGVSSGENLCFRPVVKINHMVGGGLRTNNILAEVPVYTDGSFKTVNLVKGSFISESNTSFTLLGVNTTILNFNPSTRFSSATHCNNLTIAGGVVQCYDGASPFESGYHYYPEIYSAIPSGSDGYLSAGQYQVVAVYTWTDNNGNTHYSAPSPAVTFTASANNHVTYTCTTNRFTARNGLWNNRSDISIQFYRTTANLDTFYLVTDVIDPLLNDITTDIAEFEDFASDVDIEANIPIYTNGGVLPNISPPSCSFVTLYENRIIIGGLDDPNTLWFSKNRFDNTNFNTIPTEFSSDLIIGCDPRGGDVTAIGVLNTNLIIFKPNNIFFISGDGPDDTGGGTPYPNPQMVSSSVGCENHNSILITDLGLIFQSQKGLYLLDPSVGIPGYLGSPVEGFNQYNINGANVLTNTTQLVFTTDNGPAIVYDYFTKQFVQWTNYQSVGSTIFNGKHTFAKQNGQVLQQSTSFTDNGTPISLSLTTPNFAFVGLNGFQRVFNIYILGSFKGPHNLLIEVAYDYSPIYTQIGTVVATTPTNVYGGGLYGYSPYGGEYSIYEYRIQVKQQRCTAIRLRISDQQSSAYNEGFALSSITFQVGVLPGGNRLGKSNIIGTK